LKKHYKTLGLKEGASQDEIQEAFNRLSKEIDLENNNNQEFFKEEHQKLQEAYNVLRNSSILVFDNQVKLKINSNNVNSIQNQFISNNKLNLFKKKYKSNMNFIVNKINIKFNKKIKLFFFFIGIIGIIIYLYIYFQTDINSLVAIRSDNNKWSNSVISNKVVFTKKDMKPFTGNLIMLKNNYSGKFDNGKKVGLHREYYSFNKILREGNYVNGVREGIHQEWSYDGQLICKVNYKNGKRIGLSKRWNNEGQLIALDYNENKILQYISYYFKSTKLNPIEGYYFPTIQKTEYQPGYNFAIINLDGFYYAIMTNNNKNEGDSCAYFFIGDVKAIISSIENNKYSYSWLMCDRDIENGLGYYSLENKTIVFNDDIFYFKK
jgi:hypothetical protein